MTFVDYETPVPADWLNNVNTVVNNPGSVSYTSPLTGGVSRTLNSKLSDWVSVKDFGVTGNGTTDDQPKLVVANTTGQDLLFPAGTYLINENITFNSHCTIEAGAIFKPAHLVQVTFNGGIQAPVTQIFDISLGGVFSVNAWKSPVGFAEWFGAQANTPAFDCLPAFNACHAACRVMMGLAADYYISDTFKMTVPHRLFVGQGFDDESISGTVTRVFVTNGTSNVIQMGPSSQPGTINSYTKELRLSNVFISRTVAPVVTSACTGVMNQFTLYSYVDRVKSAESMSGFHIAAVVNSHYDKNFAFRSIAGTGGTDQWYGYWLDGSIIIGSGGNASLYMHENNAGMGGITMANSNGYLLQNTWADTWIYDGEVSNCAVGYQFFGNGSTALNANQLDCQIVNPIVDQFTFAGLYFNTTNEYGMITVTGGYAAPSGVGTPTACTYYNASKAMIRVNGFQNVCLSNATCPGILLVNTFNVSSASMIGECGVSPISGANVSNCRFDDDIRNYSTTCSTYAVTMNTVARCKFNVSVSGKANAFGGGYQTITSSNFNEMNVTGLDSSSLVGNATNKFVRLGTPQVAVGLNGGTDYTQGVLA